MRKLDEFEVYHKAVRLFDCVVEDMTTLHEFGDTMRMRSQHIASADSICANIEEGAGRWSIPEYIQYLIIARGSAAETKGRYQRFHHWLADEIIQERQQRCDEIIGGLTRAINSMKKRGANE